MDPLNYLALLLCLAAFSLAEESCPPEQIGSYCTCTPGPSFGAMGTKVVCRGIKDPTTLFKEIQYYRGYKIDVLLLLFVDLPYLPAGLFLRTSVREFIIKDSILDNLYSVNDYNLSPFAGLEDSLEELAIYSTRTPSKWLYPNLKGLKHLKSVEIVQSPLNFVGHVWAEIGEGSLERITVAYSKVYRIHPQAFPELSNLKEVNFRGNSIPYMVRTMFPTPATQLRRIDLSDNKLFNLPENMFDNMPALESLDLSQNEFKTFQNMPVYTNLKIFYISNNPFKCGCHLQPLKRLLSASNLRNSDLKDVACTQTEEIHEVIPLKDAEFQCY